MSASTTTRSGWKPIGYVQDLTGFARPTLYRMAREGRIPAHRVGRSIRFDPAEIARWMAKQPKASS
jgi:excisionase family DNA binding protein